MRTSDEGITVEWLGSLDMLPAQQRAAWNAPHVSLFDSLAWTADFSLTAAASDVTPVWLHARSSDASLLLPLQFGPRPLGPIRVSSIQSLANYYTIRWQPLASINGVAADPSEIPESLWIATADALVQRRTAIATLTPVVADLAWVERLERLLSARRCSVRRTEAFGNWVADVRNMRFDDWFDRRPAALRNTWRRRKRQLERRAKIGFELYGADSGNAPRTLDDAIAAYQTVYEKSWKQPEPHPLFIPTLIRRAAERGALRLGILAADGQPIASQLWLRDGAATVIYKLAYDEAWKAFSPGLALSVELFRHAIDVDRVSLIDYGSGDDAYKRDWMDKRLVRATVTAYSRRHPVGTLLAWRARWSQGSH